VPLEGAVNTSLESRSTPELMSSFSASKVPAEFRIATSESSSVMPSTEMTIF